MKRAFSQEKIVFLLWVAIFVIFSVTLNGFLTYGNLITLIRSVSVLGTLAVGMLLIVIGRGIDLAMIANMAVSVALSFVMLEHGYSGALALLSGVGFAALFGLITGFFIAYVEVPALFATLAMGALIYGLGRSLIFTQDIVRLPEDANWINWVGTGSVAGIPVQIIFFVAISIVATLFLSKTYAGRFIYGLGDNPLAARVTGLPTRPLVLLKYTGSSLIAFVAGLVSAVGVAGMNTRIVNSTLLYDVILVVVLGGVSLSGGKGSVRNVIVGTLLIGTLLNAMTIMNVQYIYQNLAKSLILLVALVVDSVLNPRDEQTAQQGDI